MKRRGLERIAALTMVLLCVIASLGFTSREGMAQSKALETTILSAKKTKKKKAQGQIYLYGETHGVKKILDEEFETWSEFYQKQGMRHLFVELPYYTAEYLNLWMQADNDDILDQIFLDIAGADGATPENKEFYQKIKKECPETIFHGTDVGHQYNTTGSRYLKYLKKHDLKDSDQYKIVQKNIEQGKAFHKDKNQDYAARENCMVENFIRAFDELKGENIMGIYGSLHTGLNSMDSTGTIYCMAAQLKEKYGDRIHSEDISRHIDPVSTDTISINGKEYTASYYGEENLHGVIPNFECRKFWRIEDAYHDLKDCDYAFDNLPCSRYPMLIEQGQVFRIEYTFTDGSKQVLYYRSDGHEYKGEPTTEAFKVIEEQFK